MATYRNKITGEIVNAHLFDGDIDKLKKEMPHLHKDVIEEITKNKLNTGTYAIYTLCDIHRLNYIAVRLLQKRLFELMHTPYTEPTISNAQQAIKWLEEGKKIKATHWSKESYIQLLDGEVKTHGNLVYTMFCSVLFSNTWELYEKPKYKEVSGKEAIYEFLNKDKKVSLILFKSEYFLGYDETELLSLASNDRKKTLFLEQNYIQRTDWRVYEENNEC